MKLPDLLFGSATVAVATGLTLFKGPETNGLGGATRTRRKHPVRCAFGVLVDLKGFEPLTSSMPWKRAPNCATGPLLGNSFRIPSEETRDKRRSLEDCL